MLVLNDYLTYIACQISLSHDLLHDDCSYIGAKLNSCRLDQNQAFDIFDGALRGESSHNKIQLMFRFEACDIMYMKGIEKYAAIPRILLRLLDHDFQSVTRERLTRSHCLLA